MGARAPLHHHDIAFSGISKQRDEVFFLQIGAADGKQFDPIYPFVRRYGWKGILVEPLADLFELLRSNYAGQSDLIFEKVAITEKDETRSISRIPLKDVGVHGVPEWAFSASTLVPEKTRFASENSPPPLHAALSSAVVEEEVICVSLASLLEKHDVRRIDVLQIDAEGYDARIIKQLDFARFKPAIINMEWQWLTDIEKKEVSALLHNQGYTLYDYRVDLLATAAPIETFVVQSAPPTYTSVPRYFPGVTGLISRTGISESSGGCNGQPSQYEVTRYRGSVSPVHGDAEISKFMTAIDGQRSYRDIAEMTGCPEEALLQWGRELQSAYILE